MSALQNSQLLLGKVAIVTGANRGIGLAVARTFAANGAKVFACIRNVDAEKFASNEQFGGFAPDTVQAITLDLSDESSIKAAIKKIIASTQRVDILVNNAGVASGGLFQMATMAEMRRVFDVNFFGQILLTQGISRLMARHKAGSIINITSTAAQIADSGTLTYGASKSALARATLSMATELGAAGVRVNAIAPGVTRTDMFDQMTPAARDKLINSAALKRPGEPQDIANVALFFASDLSSFLTGQILRVDGGIV